MSSFASATTLEIGPEAFAPGATIVSFETGSTGDPNLIIPAELSFVQESVFGLPSGARWFAGNFSFVNMFRVPNPSFGQQAYGNFSSAPGYSDLAVVFQSPVHAVGGWLAPNRFESSSARTIEFRVLGSTGNVLGATTVTLSTDYINLANDAWRFAGLASTDAIWRAEWRIVGNTVNEGFFSVDNLTYGSVVPIPAAVWLFASALGGLAWLRRKQ